MKFEVSLTTIVRYAIPGFVGIACLFVLPFCVFEPSVLEKLNTGSGIIVVGVSAVTLGYLLDILKVYRLTIGYKRGQIELHNELSKRFKIPPAQCKTLLSRVASNEEKNDGSISILHSKWVMAQKCTFIFYLTAIVWVLIFVLSLRKIVEVNIVVCIVIAASCLVVGIRLNHMCRIEQTRIKNAYLDYAVRNQSILFQKTEGE